MLLLVASSADAKRRHHPKVDEQDEDDDSDVVPSPEPAPEKRAPARREIPALWFGIALVQDAAFVGGNDVCTGESQVNGGFSCFRASGSQYHGTPLTGVKDQVSSGLLPATTRAKLGVDYVASDELSVGMRLGYVLRGLGPPPDGAKRFPPLHFEARAAYWFDRPFSPDSFTPYIFAAAGAAEIDAHLGVDVVENQSVPPPPNQLDNPPTQHLDAYKKMGSGFGGVGVGGYLPFGQANGALFELMLLELFPSSGTALSLSAGWAFGA